MFNVICRTCLSKEDLVPIFRKPKDNLRYTVALMLATGLQVHFDDGLPQYICSICIDLVNAAIKFRNQSHMSEIKLLKLGFKRHLNPEKRKRKEKKENGDFDSIFLNQTDLIADIKEEDLKLESENDLKTELENDLKIELKERQKSVMCSICYCLFVPDSNSFDVCNTCTKSKQDEESHLKLESPILNSEPFDDDFDADFTNNLKVKKKVRKRRKNAESGPHKCNICDKMLATSAKLKTHLRTHSDKFICENCGKKCLSKQAFLQHLRGQHGMERIDKCSFCDYRAVNKAQLQIHERRHTGEKPFICDHCGSSFHRRANLLQHLAIHLTDKTIQCDECPSKFKSIKFLRAHKNKTHKRREFTHVCYVCSNRFATRFNTRLHLQRVHAIPKHQQGIVAKIRI